MRFRPAAATLAASLLLASATTATSVSGGWAANDTTSTSSSSNAPAAHITLLQQPAWTPFGADVTLHVRIDGDPSHLNVQATLHSGLSSRTAFEDTVNGDRLGPVRRGGRKSARVTDLQGRGGVYTLTGLVTAPRSSPGVYPLEVAVYDAEEGTRVDGFVTYVVTVPGAASGARPVGEQLRLSWIWPVVANPAYRANGTPDPGVVAELAPTGRLGREATLLASAADLPITVAPSPETLESWSALAATNKTLASSFDALRTGTKTVLAGPYVPVDMPALVHGDLGSEVGVQLAAGAEALGSALGIRADARTVAVDPVDPDALNQLSGAGVDRVVVDPAQLAPVSTKLTPARPFQLEARGRTLTAVATDPDLAQLIGSGAAPALAAQRFLAGLAIVALEAPNSLRGVVVQMPSRWNPGSSTSSAVSWALRGLRHNPFVKVVGMPTLLDDVPLDTVDGSPHTPLIRSVQSSSHGSLPVTAHEVRAAQDRLDAFLALVAPSDPRIRRGSRAVLVAMSSVWTGSAGRHRATQELAVIDTAVAQFVNLIRGPLHARVTITARRASIPISFQNTSTQTVKVRVRLESEKLFFPNGSDTVLALPPHNTTARFAVETRASGTFPMVVTISSADGRITFQQTRFTIRSTVVSGVGLFLMVGAGLFLAGWWANHYRRRRRGRRVARASGSTPVQRDAEAWQPTAPSRGSAR